MYECTESVSAARHNLCVQNIPYVLCTNMPSISCAWSVDPAFEGRGAHGRNQLTYKTQPRSSSYSVPGRLMSLFWGQDLPLLSLISPSDWNMVSDARVLRLAVVGPQGSKWPDSLNVFDTIWRERLVRVEPCLCREVDAFTLMVRSRHGYRRHRLSRRVDWSID